MKTAICYFSYHHGNTLKVAEAMAEAGDVDLIDLRTRQTVHLEEYDCIGLASGIYGFPFTNPLSTLLGSICPPKNRSFLSTPTAAPRGAVPRRSIRLPQKRVALFWGNSAAAALTPSARSSSSAAAARGCPARRICGARRPFIKIFVKNDLW